jgi:hypothetical protein
VLFVVTGEWASLVTRNDGCATEPQPIDNNAIFLLRNQGVSSCRIEIIGDAGKALIKVPICANFSYHVDGQSNSVIWVAEETAAGEMNCYCFKAKDGAKLRLLESQMILALYSIKNPTKGFAGEQENNWDQFYGNGNGESRAQALDDQKVAYRDYAKSNKSRFEFCNQVPGQSDHVASDNDLGFQEPIETMAQANLLDRVFVNKAGVIEVYQPEENAYRHCVSLPMLATKNKEKILPSKMFLQEQDTKLIISDSFQAKLYHYDIGKGEIISEINTKGRTKDICPFEKTSNFGHKQEFMGVSSKNIMQFDPRVAKALVKEREYATDYQFNTISSSVGGSVTVGSQTGDLRYFFVFLRNLG